MAKKRKKKLTRREERAAQHAAEEIARVEATSEAQIEEQQENLTRVERAADDAVDRGNLFATTDEHDPVVIEIMQNFVHSDSNVIRRKRTSLRYEIELADSEIHELNARLDYLTTCKTNNEGLIEGLTNILNLRKL